MATDDEIQQQVDDTINRAAAEGNKLAKQFQKQRARDAAKAERKAAKAAKKGGGC